MKLFTTIFSAAVLMFAAPQALAGDKDGTRPTPSLPTAVYHPNAGQHGMVAAQEKIAAQVGADILEAGGNAVDAAVAVGFALAVTHPQAGNLGGGGFMLVRMHETGETIAIDYRETAPAAASRDMYLGGDGEVDEDTIYYTHKASGVPGTVAGLLHAHKKFGVLPFHRVINPAIRLARRGHAMHYFTAATIEEYRDVLERYPSAREEFFKSGGIGYAPGETWRRPELAKVLRAIRRHGTDGFYKGWVADAIVDDMAAHGGLITREDLARYRVVERAPVIGNYRGHDIISFPPPSSGGILLIQMLNMLAVQDLVPSNGSDAESLHVLIEIMRRAYADRAELMGDTDFIDMPSEVLLSPDYAATRTSTIKPDRADRSDDIFNGVEEPAEGGQTTHFSVIDKDGNMVANTYTLNLSFGSGVVVPGTGIVMNNEMDDFAAKPGIPNAYGLVMGERNAIVPGKRPLSSMTPTLVLKDGEPFLSVGAQGGSRIITAVYHIIRHVIDHQMNVGEAISAPRIHHQWKPDQVLYGPSIAEDTVQALEAKGHAVVPFDWHASAHAVMVKDGWYYGYSDERGPGGAACAPYAGC
ncbi:MAG: gamma-glutamyltransferase [Pseudomonadota bacterium]